MLAGPQQDRFESLDILRGVAVLGILAINIQAMAMPVAYFANPALNTQYFVGEGRDIWAIASTFFQFKFITIFSALFGAGIILMVGEEKPSPKFGLHYRRMFWLLILGSLHAYLIWFGDILTPYAVAGLIVVLARRWRVRTLFIVGFILVALASLMMIAQHFALEYMPAEERDALLAEMFSPPPEAIAAEIEAYRGGFFARLPETAPTAVLFQVVQTLFLAPRNIGVMMFGMALYKMGFFTLGWSFLRYVVLGAVALAIGYAGSQYATTQMFAVEFDPMKLLGAQTAQFWGSLPQAFGYSALIMALAKVPFLGLVRAPFAAAGRMALSNYLMCSLIGAFLYYGPPGLGQIATVSYPEQAMTVAAIWIATLIWSPIWLTQFRFGPFEWLWRSLTYWKLQPMRKA